MSKLFKLKEWLTLEEAAAHISSVIGEPATLADLYRFALDRHLIISVNFVNHAKARKGKWVKTGEIEFHELRSDSLTGKDFPEAISIPSNCEIQVSKDDWISLDTGVSSIEGVWDLTMVGAESLDIEHAYQQMTSGLGVTLVAIDGVFVQQGDVVCQLQTDYDENEFQKGSKAQERDMEHYIAITELTKEETTKIRAEFKVKRDQYLAGRKDTPRDNLYFQSGGLDEHDYVLVIRTSEVTRFIKSLEDVPANEKPLTAKERNSLLVLIGSLCKQLEIDPSQRGVATSLVRMTEMIGAPLTDDTIRKILSQVGEAVLTRKK